MLLESYKCAWVLFFLWRKTKGKSASVFWEVPPGTSQLKVPVKEAEIKKEISPFGQVMVALMRMGFFKTCNQLRRWGNSRSPDPADFCREAQNQRRNKYLYDSVRS